jgi:hypothetical protein
MSYERSSALLAHAACSIISHWLLGGGWLRQEPPALCCDTPASSHLSPPARQVRNYFNTAGFERWNKIYGETDEVNKVQLDIRTGHAQTVEKVLKWVDAEGGVQGVTVCDAGCGTGGEPGRGAAVGNSSSWHNRCRLSCAAPVSLLPD